MKLPLFSRSLQNESVFKSCPTRVELVLQTVVWSECVISTNIKSERSNSWLSECYFSIRGIMPWFQSSNFFFFFRKRLLTLNLFFFNYKGSGKLIFPSSITILFSLSFDSHKLKTDFEDETWYVTSLLPCVKLFEMWETGYERNSQNFQ